MQLIENPYLTEQFRFPRSRKKRIRAKWANRPENSRPARKALMMGDTIVCHPTMAKLMREHIANEEAETRHLKSLGIL